MPPKHHAPPTRFPLGRLLATPAALAALAEASVPAWALLVRHARGDWGDVDEQDRAANDRAVHEGTRLLSAYVLRSGQRVWIITEADRSATTTLLPEEY